MEYAGSYALYNYHLANTSPDRNILTTPPSNIRLIRAFEHGLDPSSSEAGFVLVHIEMVRHSGPLIAGAVGCIDAASSSSGLQDRDRAALNMGLASVLGAMRRVNATMETMWARSRPTEYTSFRTFIFGITSQSMFPDGVVYEGVEELGGKPVSFRGESGANDSMVPLVDNLLGVTMPATPLTEILRDFRRYRPGEHRGFLEWYVLFFLSFTPLRHLSLCREGHENPQDTDFDTLLLLLHPPNQEQHK
jgi:indoleamine 2,3-dioxygenase